MDVKEILYRRPSKKMRLIRAIRKKPENDVKRADYTRAKVKEHAKRSKQTERLKEFYNVGQDLATILKRNPKIQREKYPRKINWAKRNIYPDFNMMQWKAYRTLENAGKAMLRQFDQDWSLDWKKIIFEGKRYGSMEISIILKTRSTILSYREPPDVNGSCRCSKKPLMHGDINL